MFDNQGETSQDNPPSAEKLGAEKHVAEKQLENFRSDLLVLAQGQIPRELRHRMDASDVVQETLMEAHQKRDQFRGENERELGGWLRTMLNYNLIDAIRSEKRGKRDARREIAQPLENSALRLADLFVADDTSPSQGLDRDERAARVSAAIQKLPEMQRKAVIMRYCDGESLAAIAKSVDKSPVAAAGLVKRGLAGLRKLLVESQA